MARLLIDTTFLVDAERSHTRLDDAVEDADDVATAAITIAELLVGAGLSSGRRRTRRMRFVDEVVAAMAVLSYDLAVAGAHAALLAEVRETGRPRGAHDLIIAATAMATDRIVVTADTAGFADLSDVRIRTYR